ncbi:MAG: DUF1611 domain-containing protein [Pseudomonadota bacterium]
MSVQTFEQWRPQLLENSETILNRVALQRTADLVRPLVADEPLRADFAETLRRSPWAHSTRRVARSQVRQILEQGTPVSGDLVLAKVDAIGHHANLQLIDGRRRRLFPGDTIVVTYGNRYASEQFEGRVPDGLGPCHLVAGGGIAAHAISWHDRISRGPTRITPLGLLGDAAGNPINLKSFVIKPRGNKESTPPVVAILGTAMDAGKTQTAAFLLRGLRNAGHRVGYIKATGTGAGGDSWLLHDAGADHVLDFTDVGMASTYLVDIERIERGILDMVQDMADHNIDVIVMEVADGVFQRETRQLISRSMFSRIVDGVVLAARDAMGAAAGIAALPSAAPPVLALSGLLTASPLQRREAEAVIGLRTTNREELATVAIAGDLLDRVLATQRTQEAS